MKITMKKLSLTAAVIAQLLASPAIAAIQRTNNYGIDFSKIIQPIESYRTIKSKDVAMMIPTDLSPSDSGSRVAVRILDHSLQNFFKSDEIRNSEIGRSAQAMEEAMEQDMSFGGADEGSVKHNIKFQMKPVQSRAQIDYTGYVKAQLSYQIARATLNFEVYEKVSDSTDLVVSHEDSKVDRRDMVSFRFRF